MTLSGKLTIVREKFWVLELQSKCYKRKLEIGSGSEKIKSNAEMKSSGGLPSRSFHVASDVFLLIRQKR